MINRRQVLKATAATIVAPALLQSAHAQQVPGVTATEIKIGNTMPYSGPVSRYGTVGRAEAAYFNMINEKGGINGRRINFLSYDDAASPPKTVEQIRRLVEQDQVSFVFSMIGTASNTAVLKYLNQRKVPHLFILTGADKWSDYKETPWSIGWQPSYRIEGRIYAKYIQQNRPDGKVGIIYQNDDFGKDYLAGLRDVFGEKRDIVLASYETSDPTVDSQVIALKQAGVDVLVNAGSAKWAAMVIRKVSDLEWKPLHIMSNVSTSVGAVMQPAGADRAVGIVSSSFFKDPTEPAWEKDPGMEEWRAFMKKYYAEGDLQDSNNVWGYSLAHSIVHVLKACGNDLSRENIMKQITTLNKLENPVLLPGISLSTSPTNYRPITQLQMIKWNGKSWDRFGDVIQSQ